MFFLGDTTFNRLLTLHNEESPGVFFLKGASKEQASLNFQCQALHRYLARTVTKWPTWKGLAWDERLVIEESPYTYLLAKPQTCIEQSLVLKATRKYQSLAEDAEKTKSSVAFFKIKWFPQRVIFLQWFVGNRNYAWRSGNHKQNYVTVVIIGRDNDTKKSMWKQDNSLSLGLSFLMK